jgi:hypothetical protein
MSDEAYKDLSLFIKEFGAGEFKPFAYYDRHLDCIRVRIRDCSVIEQKLSKIFTVLRAAHADYEVSVGFTIKGIRHLFESIGLPSEGVFALAHIIDQIVRVYPDAFVRRVQEEFGSIIEREQIQVEVEIDDAHEEAA